MNRWMLTVMSGSAALVWVLATSAQVQAVPLGNVIEFSAPLVIQMNLSTTTSGDHPLLPMTVTQSDLSIALFGCDCPACHRKLEQLESLSLRQG